MLPVARIPGLVSAHNVASVENLAQNDLAMAGDRE
jgi:hypothetical protein